MSRSSHVKIKLSLVILLLFALACDAGSALPFMQAPTARVPTARIPGPYPTVTPSGFGPSVIGWVAFINNNRVWLMHPDGSGLKQVSKNSVPSDPSAPAAHIHLGWSNDGQKLAFSEDGHINVLDMAGLALSQLTVDTAGGFQWSPGGYQIIYDGPLTVGQQQAYDYSNDGLSVVDAQTGRSRLLVKSTTKYPAMVDPLWSFDGTHVIFSDPDGAERGGVHMVDILSGAIVDLIPRGATDGNCNWSTTELTAACLEADPSSPGAFNVVLLDGKGSEKRKIPLPTGLNHPRLGPWSLDGSRVAIVYFADEGSTQPKTDLLALDSGDIKPLAPGAANDWSPDGRWILAQGAEDPPIMAAINTTSGLSTPLQDGSSPLWQPGELILGWQPSDSMSAAPTEQAFCMDTTIYFIRQPKGYYFQVCAGSQHYQLGPLAKGVYTIGPGGNFFLYASNDGIIYVARVGDRGLTQIGNVRDFVVIRKHNDPLYQFRFFGDNPYSVQVSELKYGENVTLQIPHSISAP
jgi:hypothetical protein